MNTQHISLTILLAFTIFISGCSKDDEAPEIDITTPANHSEHQMGDELHITAEFTDNEALASCRVAVGDENGDHTHDFHFEEEKDIDGTSYTLHTHTDIPEEIDEVYYLHFEVTDAEGNSTSQKSMLHFK